MALCLLRRSFCEAKVAAISLASIANLEMLEKEKPRKIQEIWNTYHSGLTNTVSCVLSIDQYDTLTTRIDQCKQFMYPIMRKEKVFHLVSIPNFQNSILFRNLDDYRKRKENDMFKLHYFDELMGEKRIALVRGEIVDEQVSKVEAERLLQMFMAHYLETGLYERSVYKFNHDPDRFDVDEYVGTMLSTFFTVPTAPDSGEQTT